MSKIKENILNLDKNYLWHPFTPIKDSAPILISNAKNEILKDIDGNEYIDLISSWWVNIHGHCNEHINNRINLQINKLEQVLFAGFTHSPAVNLAKELTSLLPDNMNRVFYSDNGSTSVEIALKTAIQFWHNKGEKKKRFVAFRGGYHGDTFGAMSVGYTSGYYEPFKDFLVETDFISFPEFWKGNNEVEKNESYALSQISEILEKKTDEIAAVIIEPLIQGAGGMRICRKEFLEKVVLKFQSAGVIVIFDEVMTGFGRTGKMFACDHMINAKPDIICLAKSITGGYLPLAATIFSDFIYKEFITSDVKKSLLHGHTYTANPIACEAALGSIELFKINNSLTRISELEKIHKKCLNEVESNLDVSKVRILGSIAAFDVNKIDKSYGSVESNKLKTKFLENGLLLRPIGNTIYLMPPYCISKEKLIQSYEKIIEILK